MSATVAVPGKPLSEASPSVDGRTKRGPKRVRKTGRTVTKAGSRRRSSEAKAAVRRTSDILKKLISDESQQALTVEQIVQALGPTSFGTSLMVSLFPRFSRSLFREYLLRQSSRRGLFPPNASCGTVS